MFRSNLVYANSDTLSVVTSKRKRLMGVLATLESLELDDVDQLNGVSSNWTIESIQLKPGQHRFSARRIVFPDLMVERYRSNLAKHDLYELPKDTTLITIFRPGISPGHWCGYSIPDDVALINQSGREHFAVLPCGHEGIAILIDNVLLARWNLLPDSLYQTCRISPQQIIPLNNPVSLEAHRWFFEQFDTPNSMSELARDPTTRPYPGASDPRQGVAPPPRRSS